MEESYVEENVRLFHEFNMESVLTELNEYCDTQGKEFISLILSENVPFIQRESDIKYHSETNMSLFVWSKHRLQILSLVYVLLGVHVHSKQKDLHLVGIAK